MGQCATVAPSELTDEKPELANANGNANGNGKANANGDARNGAGPPLNRTTNGAATATKLDLPNDGGGDDRVGEPSRSVADSFLAPPVSADGSGEAALSRTPYRSLVSPSLDLFTDATVLVAFRPVSQKRVCEWLEAASFKVIKCDSFAEAHRHFSKADLLLCDESSALTPASTSSPSPSPSPSLPRRRDDTLRSEGNPGAAKSSASASPESSATGKSHRKHSQSNRGGNSSGEPSTGKPPRRKSSRSSRGEGAERRRKSLKPSDGANTSKKADTLSPAAKSSSSTNRRGSASKERRKSLSTASAAAVRRKSVDMSRRLLPEVANYLTHSVDSERIPVLFVGHFQLLSSQANLLSSLTDICAKPMTREALLTRVVKLLELSHLLRSVNSRRNAAPSDMPAFSHDSYLKSSKSMESLDSVGELSPMVNKNIDKPNLRDTLQSMASDRTVIVRTSVSEDEREDAKGEDDDDMECSADLDSKPEPMSSARKSPRERRQSTGADEKGSADHSRSLSPLPTIPATNHKQAPVSELNLNRPPSTRSESMSKSYDLSLELPRPAFPTAFTRSLPAPDMLQTAPAGLLSASFAPSSNKVHSSSSVGGSGRNSQPPSPQRSPLERARSTAPSQAHATHPSRSRLHPTSTGSRGTLRSRSPSKRRLFQYKTLNPAALAAKSSSSASSLSSSDAEFPHGVNFRRRGSGLFPGVGLVLSTRGGVGGAGALGHKRRRASLSVHSRMAMHRSSVDAHALQLTATPLDQVLSDLGDLIKDPANKALAPKLKDMLLQLTSSEVMSPTLFANSTAVIRRDGQQYMLTEMVPGVGRRWSTGDSLTELIDEIRDGDFSEFEEDRSSVVSSIQEEMRQTPPTSKLIEWEFNVLDSTNKITYMLLPMLRHFEILKRFNIEEGVLAAFMCAARDTYLENPYHNFEHGAAVLQSSFSMLTEFQLARKLTHIDIFALLVSSLMHDAGHPGTNNSYQIKVQTDLAVIYNDKHVLENHHCHLTAQTLRDTGLLEPLSPAQQKDFRNAMISMILATDLADHFAFVSAFKARMMTKPSEAAKPPATPTDPAKPSSESREFVRNIIIKGADIGNVCREWPVAHEWSDLVAVENFDQGDMEKNAGLTPPTFCDREKTNADQSTVDFISFVARPLFELMADFDSRCKKLLVNVDSNRNKFRQAVEDSKAKTENPPSPSDGKSNGKSDGKSNGKSNGKDAGDADSAAGETTSSAANANDAGTNSAGGKASTASANPGGGEGGGSSGSESGDSGPKHSIQVDSAPDVSSNSGKDSRSSSKSPADS